MSIWVDTVWKGCTCQVVTFVVRRVVTFVVRRVVTHLPEKLENVIFLRTFSRIILFSFQKMSPVCCIGFYAHFSAFLQLMKLKHEVLVQYVNFVLAPSLSGHPPWVGQSPESFCFFWWDEVGLSKQVSKLSNYFIMDKNRILGEPEEWVRIISEGSERL